MASMVSNPTGEGDGSDVVASVAWKLHYHRTPHVGGTHETANGARGVNCNGPDELERREARKIVQEVVRWYTA